LPSENAHRWFSLCVVVCGDLIPPCPPSLASKSMNGTLAYPLCRGPRGPNPAAIRTRRRHLIGGSGIAGFIPAAIPVNNDTVPPQRSMRPELGSKAARNEYLPKRCEADFEEWRENAAYHVAKYSGWDRKGERRI
jgi:hypothetical protein